MKLQSSSEQLNEKKEIIKRLETEITTVQAEKKRLESKASLADELTTLMDSLTAVRAENGYDTLTVSAKQSISIPFVLKCNG